MQRAAHKKLLTQHASSVSTAQSTRRKEQFVTDIAQELAEKQSLLEFF